MQRERRKESKLTVSGKRIRGEGLQSPTSIAQRACTTHSDSADLPLAARFSTKRASAAPDTLHSKHREAKKPRVSQQGKAHLPPAIVSNVSAPAEHPSKCARDVSNDPVGVLGEGELPLMNTSEAGQENACLKGGTGFAREEQDPMALNQRDPATPGHAYPADELASNTLQEGAACAPVASQENQACQR